MSTTGMRHIRSIERQRPKRYRGTSRASAQSTVTERHIDCGGQVENDSGYTISDAESSHVDSDMVPVWLSDALEQLQAIATLPDGWDSYGAPAPDTDKVESAWSLLFCLCVNTDLPQPFVNPTRNGGVQFEWEAGSRYFELELVDEGAAAYLYCDTAAQVEETGSIFQDGDLLEPVRERIRKVATTQ